MLTLLQILKLTSTAAEAIKMLVDTRGDSIMEGWSPTALFNAQRRCIEYTDKDGTNHVEELVLDKNFRPVRIDHLTASMDAPYLGDRCPNT